MAGTRTALVTGATDGVGRVVALRLGQQGWNVLVHGRDAGRGVKTVDDIRANGGQASVYLADLASMDGVRNLAGAVVRSCPELRLLINNAGIGYGVRGAGREIGADGLELRFSVNYLAPFLLTRLLMPNLIAGAPARVVNVASNVQDTIDFADLQMERHYSGRDAYRRAKLALVMETFSLAGELATSHVTVNAIHPATSMDTFMVREAGGAVSSSVEEGADAILHLAVSPEMEARSGEYFDAKTPARAHEQAYDPAARERLRRLSLSLCGLGPSHSAAQ
ncbi:MAG: SDR family NAD(P)-dependent oxidoreductase [Rhodomicrobiaceae bacterium]